MIERIARALHLETDEARRALALAGIVFLITCSYTLVKTARDALFLARLPASLLPQVFLAVGVLTTVSAALFTRFTRRRSTWTSLEIAIWASAIVLAGFAWVFGLRASWVPVAFYLWVNVYGLILIAQFWTYTNAVSDPHEAKRILGVVGTGAILGGLFGGILAQRLAGVLSLQVLVIAAALVAVAAAPLVRTGPRDVPPPPAPRAGDPARSTNPLAHRYVRWLALAALCSVLVTTLLDYQFKVAIQIRDPSPRGLTAFLGMFYTVTNLAALTVQLFFTRWVLHRFGAAWGAAVLPAGILAGAAAILVVPGFVTVITARLWDQVMRLSVNKTAVQLFYFPLEPGLRRRAKAWIDAGLERIGDAVAGLLLVGLGMTMGVNAWTVALVLTALVVVWIAAWLGVRRGYVVELGRNLRRLSPAEHEPVSLRESNALHEMERLVESPFERVALHGIEMLDEAAPERLVPRLADLLGHASPRVRARTLALATEHGIEDVEERVVALMRDPDPEVQIAAMRARCALGGENPLGVLEPFLEAPEPSVRRSALHCIVEYAPPSDEGAVRAVIDRMLRSEGVDRAAVAEALGRRGPGSGLLDMLPPLLDDPAPAVRNAALVSAGRTRQRTLIPVMIERLAQSGAREAAREALAAFGDTVVGTLGDYLCDGTVPIAVRREIPRVLGQIGTPGAVLALFRCRDRGDVRLSYRVLKAANRIRMRDPRVRFPEELVTEDIEHDIRSHLFALVHYRACPIGGARTAERLLCIVLNERMDQALNRVFRRLALLYPPGEIHAGYRGVLSADPRVRGNAIEYLENALSPAHATLVLPLVGDVGDEGRLRLAETRYGLRYTSFVATLDEILGLDDMWLRACALFVVGSRGERSLRGHVDRGAASPDPILRETAAWARLALAGR